MNLRTKHNAVCPGLIHTMLPIQVYWPPYSTPAFLTWYNYQHHCRGQVKTITVKCLTRRLYNCIWTITAMEVTTRTRPHSLHIKALSTLETWMPSNHRKVHAVAVVSSKGENVTPNKASSSLLLSSLVNCTSPISPLTHALRTHTHI